uniref:NADH-ubiquinone oxidoreductase chain 3 n=1 Tax=Flaccisagitta enflata TaxID=366393 RepID=D3DKN4_9BILA|nr:NADH dehydrogenase subunit 3 [Flaccisagitta enflata]BAI68183.1 NADH dehydrogenase subunit 3 [Flaccisagitta enflata]
MFFSLLITFFLTFLILLNYKVLLDKEKASPFECGFDPNNISRLPFCLKFFLIVVIFLVFDVEVALLLPMIFSSFSVFSFIVVLALGTFYEWAFGGLTWMV